MDLIVFLLDALVTPDGRPSLYAMLIALAGTMMVVGMRKTSINLIVIAVTFMVIGSPIVEGIIDSFLDQLPGWAFWSLMAAMTYGFVQWVLVRLMGEVEGKETTRKGLLLVLREALFSPFRLGWFLITSGPTARFVLFGIVVAAAVIVMQWKYTLW